MSSQVGSTLKYQAKIRPEFYDNKVINELRKELEKIEKLSRSPEKNRSAN